MRRGRYDERLTIQTQTTSADSAGGRSITWTTYGQWYGNVREPNGRELFRAEQTQNPVTHIVTIPNSNTGLDIRPKMRVLRGDASTVLVIHSVRKSERLDMELYLDCVEERP